jgi:hypothetical protein
MGRRGPAAAGDPQRPGRRLRHGAALRLAEARGAEASWNDVDFANAAAATRIKGGAIVRRALTAEMIVLIANQPKVGPFVFTYVCRKTTSRHRDKLGRLQPARQKGQRYPLTATVLREALGRGEESGRRRGLPLPRSSPHRRHQDRSRHRQHRARQAGARAQVDPLNAALCPRPERRRPQGLDAANSRNSPESRNQAPPKQALHWRKSQENRMARLSRCKRDALPAELTALPSEMAAFRPILKLVFDRSRNGAETRGIARCTESRNTPE